VRFTYIHACHLIGAVRHRQGRHLAKATAQARAHRLWPAEFNYVPHDTV